MRNEVAQFRTKHPAMLRSHSSVDGGVMDCKAVRVAGQGARAVELDWSLQYKRGEEAWSLRVESAARGFSRAVELRGVCRRGEVAGKALRQWK